MSRLITFGCSFTVGTGLPDVYPDQYKHSLIGWPNLLGEKLGLEVVNKGQAGAGNLEILYYILNTDIRPDDTCVVMWSAFLRHDQFVIHPEFNNGKRIPYNIFAKNTPIEDTAWIDANRNKNWLTIHHGSHYLNNLGVRFRSLLGINQGPITGEKPSQLHIPNLIEDIKPKHWIVDEALDAEPDHAGHPGLESQRLISQMIYDRIV